MKRNRLFILGIVTVLVALLSLTLVSGTFAKYTSSSATASDSARVAKWDIAFKDITGTEKDITAEVDLFDANYKGDATGHTTEDTVKSQGTDNLVAPGTTKSAKFKVVNKSEVSAQISLAATLTNTGNIPLKWSLKVDNGSATEYASFDALVEAINEDLGYMLPQAVAGTEKTFEIIWQWPFEEGTSPAFEDSRDTNLGTASTLATLSASFTFTATQVD